MGLPSRITTISFDGDDTLWDFTGSMKIAMKAVLAELRRLAPETPADWTPETLIAHRTEVGAELPEEIDMMKMRLLGFRRTCERLGRGGGDGALAARLTDIYFDARRSHTPIYDDTIATLEALRLRYALGYISNGPVHPSEMGLPDVFRFVVRPQDCMAAKPSPAPFEMAMGLVGCSSRQMLHVGDSLGADVAGARGAGVLSAWLNRTGRPNETGIEPDFEIQSLAELV